MIKKPVTSGLQVLRNFIPVIPFIVLVFALAFIGKIYSGSSDKPGLGFYLWVLSPMLACIIIRSWKKDWSEFGIRPRIKSKWRWYIVSLVAYPLTLFITVSIGRIFGIVEITNITLPAFFKQSRQLSLHFLSLQSSKKWAGEDISHRSWKFKVSSRSIFTSLLD
jgi:hypothetical protein